MQDQKLVISDTKALHNVIVKHLDAFDVADYFLEYVLHVILAYTIIRFVSGCVAFSSDPVCLASREQVVIMLNIASS